MIVHALLMRSNRDLAHVPVSLVEAVVIAGMSSRNAHLLNLNRSNATAALGIGMIFKLTAAATQALALNAAHARVKTQRRLTNVNLGARWTPQAAASAMQDTMDQVPALIYPARNAALSAPTTLVLRRHALRVPQATLFLAPAKQGLMAAVWNAVSADHATIMLHL